MLLVNSQYTEATEHGKHTVTAASRAEEVSSQESACAIILCQHLVEMIAQK